MSIGAELILPEAEAHHAKVLRLTNEHVVQIIDESGRQATATLLNDAFNAFRIKLLAEPQCGLKDNRVKLTLAIAWPKGKRAAFMVEKCAELGVERIIPIHYERSVVSKDESSEGLIRLRRIAAEASKQSGRETILAIEGEKFFDKFLTALPPGELAWMLDASGEPLGEALQKVDLSNPNITLFIGPEGGFSPSEFALADRCGIQRLSMAVNVLRVETAAIAASAICLSFFSA
jgi:16S rRNA (uracil1498-N3)-methyltransferase